MVEKKVVIKLLLNMISMRIPSSENKQFLGKLLYAVLKRYRHTRGVPTRNTRQQALELT